MTTDTYQALAAVVLIERPLDDVLAEIVTIANRALVGAESTSITLVRGDRAWTAAHVGQLAVDADELQYDDGYGPCMDAGRTGLTMHVPDMSADERWPTYAPRAVERGVLSSLSVPLPFQGRTIGALNNYASTKDAFSDDDLRVGEHITSYIGTAVMNADAHADATASVEQMRAALDSRKVIDMALGILIARHHCTADEAFALLSQASQNHNRKLRDLAQSLVESEGRQA
ncbi:MAG: GAF and ANTAR domain-containing protein [Angustibacter sp.]